MDDPEEWLPDFFKDHWDQAVESLRAQATRVTEPRPDIWPANDPRSGGNIMEKPIVKLYEVSDAKRTRITHGDLDKDTRWDWAIDIKRKLPRGDPKVRRQVHEIALILERVLDLYRRNPQEDWNEVSDVNIQTVTNFGDYQHRVVHFTLRRYGEIMPAMRLQTVD